MVWLITGKSYPFKKEVLMSGSYANCVIWLGLAKLPRVTVRGILAMIMKIKKTILKILYKPRKNSR
jgi:hypothetical protein